MSRSMKKKEPSLMDELKERNLLDEGELVEMPDLEVDDLIEENALSIIVRCLNPSVHKVGGLVKALPPIWGLEDRVKGRGVGENQAQFIFRCEKDLNHVLEKGPWFVNGWMVALDRWTLKPGPDFMNLIPFWIRIRGLPIHLLKRQAIESLISPLGKVDAVELHAKNSDSLEYVRVHAWVKADEPLQFRRVACFKYGEKYQTKLEYEKLIKVCFLCKRLTHDQSACPLQIEEGKSGRQSEGITKNSSKKALISNHREKGKGLNLREQNSADGMTINHPQEQKDSPAGIQKRLTLKERMSRSSNYQKAYTSQRKVWREKELSSNLKISEGGSSASLGESVQSSQRHSNSEKRTPTNISENYNQALSDTTPIQSVFQRLSSPKEGMRMKDLSPMDDSGRKAGEVFERLRSGSSSRGKGDGPQSKRKRLSSSDERRSKRARMESSGEGKSSPSVFSRLRESSSGGNANNSGRKESLYDSFRPESLCF